MPEQSQHNRPGEINRREALKTLVSAAAGAVMPNPAVGMPAPLAVLTSQQKASGAAALLGEVLKLAQATNQWHRRPHAPLTDTEVLQHVDGIINDEDESLVLLDQSFKRVKTYSENFRSNSIAREEAFKHLLNVRDELFSSPDANNLISRLKQGCLELNKRCLQLIADEFETCSNLANIDSEVEKSTISEKISRLECRDDRVMPYTDAYRDLISLIVRMEKGQKEIGDKVLDCKLDDLIDECKAEIEIAVFNSLGLSRVSAERYVDELPGLVDNLFSLFFDALSDDFGSFNLLNLDPEVCFSSLGESGAEESTRIRDILKNVRSWRLDNGTRIEQQIQSSNLADSKSSTEVDTGEFQLRPDEPEIKDEGDGYLLVSDPKFVLEEGPWARLLNLAWDSFKLTGQMEAIAAKARVDVTRCDDQADVTYKVQFPEPADNSRDVLVAIRMMSQGFGDVSFHVPESKKPQVISMLQGEALFLLIKNSDPKVVSLKAGSFAECIFHVELFGVGGAGV